MDDRIIGILQEALGKILIASVEVTIPLTVFGFALAMVVALFMALVQYANIKVLKQFARFYIWIFRGTPLLVQLFLAYFGLPKLGIVMDAFPCALLVLGLNEGAYCAETLRSALESVSEGQIEAGYCVGMNYIQIMWHVVLPQAFRTAFPPLSNSLISMLKDTSLAATITVADMFMAAQRVVGRTYEPLWVYSEVALVYLFMSTLLTILQHYGEKKLGSYTSKETEIKEVAD
ncbi:MAG: amino acid ABC transporter permease [Lachnobacterium sp.]|nr:amino acid ABC transporter permease [Lachnobacterium sp.]MDD6633637.1 amino acid ABC transporter permease [Lachnobacterium sp.]